jgi:hypothetical protein
MFEAQTADEALDHVHTAETLMSVAELHWRAANDAAQAAKNEFDTARRVYTSARREFTACQVVVASAASGERA